MINDIQFISSKSFLVLATLPFVKIFIYLFIIYNFW